MLITGAHFLDGTPLIYITIEMKGCSPLGDLSLTGESPLSVVMYNKNVTRVDSLE